MNFPLFTCNKFGHLAVTCQNAERHYRDVLLPIKCVRLAIVYRGTGAKHHLRLELLIFSQQNISDSMFRLSVAALPLHSRTFWQQQD